jgi:hypothetical protein
MKINDEITDGLETINSVSSYIEQLRRLQKKWRDDNWFIEEKLKNSVLRVFQQYIGGMP